ncbi:MAG: hypothetical protein P1P88_16845, partial [Bacteroidales bacterium]|nr:hypothetical protein [Bacteroidales bacterium]
MRTIFILFIFIGISFNHAIAQELIYPEIEKELTEEQKGIIDDAVKVLLKATGNENNANAIDGKYAKKRNKPDWEEKTWEAKAQRIIAERNYAVAYKMISDVYSDVITNAGYLSESDKYAALALNRDADAKFEKAATVMSKYNDLSQETMATTPYQNIISDIKNSHDFKISAVRDQISALQIYERGVKKQLDNDDIAEWEKATKANTIEAYYEYLDNNQRGKFMAEAN